MDKEYALFQEILAKLKSLEARFESHQRTLGELQRSRLLQSGGVEYLEGVALAFDEKLSGLRSEMAKLAGNKSEGTPCRDEMAPEVHKNELAEFRADAKLLSKAQARNEKVQEDLKKAVMHLAELLERSVDDRAAKIGELDRRLLRLEKSGAPSAPAPAAAPKRESESELLEIQAAIQETLGEVTAGLSSRIEALEKNAAGEAKGQDAPAEDKDFDDLIRALVRQWLEEAGEKLNRSLDERIQGAKEEFENLFRKIGEFATVVREIQKSIESQAQRLEKLAEAQDDLRAGFETEIDLCQKKIAEIFNCINDRPEERENAGDAGGDGETAQLLARLDKFREGLEDKLNFKKPELPDLIDWLGDFAERFDDLHQIQSALLETARSHALKIEQALHAVDARGDGVGNVQQNLLKRIERLENLLDKSADANAGPEE